MEKSRLALLLEKIERRQAHIGVIGLGYVGLPVAVTFARAGFPVTGVDLKADRVAVINIGRNPIEGREPELAELLQQVVRSGQFRATTDHQDLSGADVVLVNVETPVDEDHRPDYRALKAACRDLGSVLKRGVLIIVESTVAPGTTGRVVAPLLEEQSSFRVNEEFFLGVCPERVMPGKLLANLRSMSRVCGGGTPQTAEIMVALYRHIVDADLDVTDWVTAELVKTAENAYRDVQIAFANEVALICEAVGADVWRVRELVNKVPSRQMHLPGAGVGGHCIPKDPWLLAYGGQDKVPAKLLAQARAVNDGMPRHMVKLVVDALAEAGVEPAAARVAVLGYAYLEESDDTRNSPSEVTVTRLRELGVEVVIHDPYVPLFQGPLLERVSGSDAVVVMVAHDVYRQIVLQELKSVLRTAILVDGRHLFRNADVTAAGFLYRGVGQG